MSSVVNLSAAPARDVVHKQVVADVVDCPSLGAVAKETRANPLLDDFAGMAIAFDTPRHIVGVSLISDDNFSATQTTRVLNLAARLPQSLDRVDSVLVMTPRRQVRPS